MSAEARNYAYIVKIKKDAKSIPTMSKKRLAEAKANVAKHLIKK